MDFMLESPRLRLLTREELHRLKKFYKKAPGRNPVKELFSAAVAELSDETIVGYCGFELVPHCGPIEILPEYQHKGLGVKLYETIEAELDKKPGTGYYTFPSNDAAKALMKKMGLTKLDWEVWKREY